MSEYENFNKDKLVVKLSVKNFLFNLLLFEYSVLTVLTMKSFLVINSIHITYNDMKTTIYVFLVRHHVSQKIILRSWSGVSSIYYLSKDGFPNHWYTFFNSKHSNMCVWLNQNHYSKPIVTYYFLDP